MQARQVANPTPRLARPSDHWLGSHWRAGAFILQNEVAHTSPEEADGGEDGIGADDIRFDHCQDMCAARIRHGIG